MSLSELLIIQLDFRHNTASFASWSQLSVILPNVLMGVQNPPLNPSPAFLFFRTSRILGSGWQSDICCLKSLDLDLNDLQGHPCFGEHLRLVESCWQSQKLLSVRDVDPMMVSP